MNEFQALSLRVPLQLDEPPPYFASRLAARNFRTARAFAQDMGIRFQDLVDGDESAVTALADLGAASLPDLLNSAVRTNRNSVSFKGQMLQSNLLRRARIHVCPQCLQDDIARSDLPPNLAMHGRANWMLTVIRTCPVHCKALIEVAHIVRPSETHDWTQIVSHVVDDLHVLADRAASRPPSAFETYLANRLGGRTADIWLDDMNFYAAVHMTELVGAVASFGKLVNLRALGEDQLYQAGCNGFTILQKGPDGLLGLMSEMRSALLAQGMDAHDGPQAVYGRLYSYLAHGLSGTAFDQVREIMTEHILSVFPLGPGDMLFRKPVTQRRVHSIRSASREYKIHPRRFRKVLAAEGFLFYPLAADNHVILDADTAQRIAARIQDTVRLPEAARILGSTYLTADRLVKAGLVRKHNIGSDGVLLATELKGFLSQLHRDAISVERPATGTMSINFAARRANCTTIDIVRLILDRKLRWVGRHLGRSGYDSILVDINEIRLFVRPNPSADLPFGKARKLLKTNDRALLTLLEIGAIQSKTMPNPVGGQLQRRIPLTELTRFDSTYVSLHRLWREAGVAMTMASFRRELDSRGVRPAPELSGAAATFYRRSDLHA
ncbi:TniQ family protein [Bradyrhizobium sp. SZCCHNR3107]|uniref:TniQ family protein n=1 Tax=Bradyrhizobium sp. SZCCHNR3107 TaxID=3057459 RepID=UPI0028F04463|nr:TniQ family protein [Bradyrhizobium sp. SZCCHNR3107]